MGHVTQGKGGGYTAYRRESVVIQFHRSSSTYMPPCALLLALQGRNSVECKKEKPLGCQVHHTACPAHMRTTHQGEKADDSNPDRLLGNMCCCTPGQSAYQLYRNKAISTNNSSNLAALSSNRHRQAKATAGRRRRWNKCVEQACQRWEDERLKP